MWEHIHILFNDSIRLSLKILSRQTESYLCFYGFEKNSKYTPNTNLIAASIYATNTNEISVKI